MSDTDSAPDADRRLGELLRAAGPRPQPSAEQMERWQAGFAAELEARRRPRRRPRRWRGWRLRVAAGLGACAAALLLAVLLFPGATPVPAAPVAQVVVTFGGNVVREADGGITRLAVGASIAAGTQVESGLYSGLGLSYRGADVRLDSATTVVVGAERLELRSGRVYVDTGSGGSATLAVQTPFGWFEHLGTQFLVAVTDSGVIGAVREGRIVLHQGADDLLLVAAADGARMVVVGDGGDARQSAASSSGELWAWAESASVGIDLSAHSVAEVLRWAARERGQRLAYASPAVRERAERARLPGTGERLGPTQAIEVVVAATDLRVVAGEGSTLSVSLGSATDRSEADQNTD